MCIRDRTYSFTVNAAGTYDVAVRLCYPFWDKNGIYAVSYTHLDVYKRQQLFVSLIQNLPTIIVEIVKAVPQIIAGIVNAFTLSMGQIVNIGKNIVQGLWQGIQKMCIRDSY